MPVDRSYTDRNDASRAHLREVVERVDDATLALALEGEWTGGMLLAHLAFWDRLVLTRWEHAIRDGLSVPVGLDETQTDLVNAASEDIWRALPVRHSAELALVAAESVDALVAGIDDGRAQAVLDAGLPRLLERSFHRLEHLAPIERAAGRTA